MLCPACRHSIGPSGVMCTSCTPSKHLMVNVHSISNGFGFVLKLDLVLVMSHVRPFVLTVSRLSGVFVLV